MTKQSALRVMGYLFRDGNYYLKNEETGYIYDNSEGCPVEVINKMYHYLQTVRLSLKFVKQLITGEIRDYYHNINDAEYLSEYDYIEIDYTTGRIGIWCEPDGFIAWLDEYNKKWWLKERDK